MAPRDGGPVDSRSRRDRRRARKAEKAARKRAGRTARGGVAAGGRQRPTKTIVVALIVGGLVVSGLLLASVLEPGATGAGGGAAGATVIEAQPFDPQGDGNERGNIAPLAVDGDPESFWRTDTYRRAGLGNLKDGVGLILVLDSEASLDQIELQTANQGWSAEVYVGEGFGPNDGAFELAALGEPAGAVEDGGATEVIDLGGARGSQVLLWITETGTTPDRNDIDVFRYVLYEVVVR